MNVTILEGASRAAQRLAQLEPRIEKLSLKNITPTLAIILVGDDSASHTYVGIKTQRAREVGIKVNLKEFKETDSQAQIEQEIERLNHDQTTHAIIVQLPLPTRWDVDKILAKIAPEKDVDGLGSQQYFSPPTPQAIMSLLRLYDVDLAHKNIAIVGYGRLVGRPLSKLLESEGIPFSVYSLSHGTIDRKLLKEDIVISATGTKVITKDNIKPGAVVVNAAQDMDFDDIKEVAGALTPPVGGVGPLTVAILLEHVVSAAVSQAKVGGEGDSGEHVND